MPKHKKHRMHKNSLEEYAKLQRGSRRWQIMQIVKRHKRPLTDLEIAQKMVNRGWLRSIDCVNAFRPRITGLINCGLLIELSENIKCTVSGKKLRGCICRL